MHFLLLANWRRAIEKLACFLIFISKSNAITGAKQDHLQVSIILMSDRRLTFEKKKWFFDVLIWAKLQKRAKIALTMFKKSVYWSTVNDGVCVWGGGTFIYWTPVKKENIFFQNAGNLSSMIQSYFKALPDPKRIFLDHYTLPPPKKKN